MRIGKSDDPNYEADILKMYGSQASLRFELDDLMDECLEKGFEPGKIASAVADKSLEESKRILNDWLLGYEFERNPIL